MISSSSSSQDLDYGSKDGDEEDDSEELDKVAADCSGEQIDRVRSNSIQVPEPPLIRKKSSSGAMIMSQMFTNLIKKGIEETGTKSSVKFGHADETGMKQPEKQRTSIHQVASKVHK